STTTRGGARRPARGRRTCSSKPCTRISRKQTNRPSRRRRRRRPRKRSRRIHMTRKLLMLTGAVAFTAAVAYTAVPAYAHHSFAATYFEDKTDTIEGDLVQFLFRNPHSFVHVEGKDEKGETVRYAIEWGGGGALGRQGVTRATLKPGDHGIIVGNPERNPHAHRLRMVRLKRTSDGWTWGGRPGETFD